MDNDCLPFLNSLDMGGTLGANKKKK